VTGLLGDIGKKLGEKWVALLVLPGLLYGGAVVVAYVLGWKHAMDIPRLASTINAWSASAAVRSAGGAILIIAAVLLASTGVALAAEALGTAIARCWLAEHWTHWPAPIRALARRVVRARASRWDQAVADYQEARNKVGRSQALAEAGLAPEEPYDMAELYYPVARVARERPTRPTWVGDRVNAVAVALHRRYSLDLPTVWPALSLTIPGEASTAIDAARRAYRHAATLAAWSLLYVAVGIAWWPGLAIAGIVAVTAAYRARIAVEDYSLLVEAAVVLHTPGLLRTVGIAHTGALDRRAGNALTCYLQGDPRDA
jgi:hypothetical protein